MKANELMIGDILRVNKDVCIKKDTIVQVRCIDADEELIGRNLKVAVGCVPLYREPYDYGRGGVWLNYLEPIPLTREILKKNGFDVSDREVMYYYFTLEGSPVWQREYFALKQMYDKETKEPKGFSYFVCYVLTIFDYVHQLQHALRMVGLTELADNFKV